MNDARGTARAQRIVAFALMQMGRPGEAKAAIEQALAASRARGDAFNVANCLDMQAAIAVYRGDVRAARELFAQALSAYKALGNEAGTAVVLSNTGELEFGEGHPELALQAASEALEILTRGKDVTNIAIGHLNRAVYQVAVGELSAARESAREGLRLARQVRDEVGIAGALQHLALLAALGDEARRSAQLLGYVDWQFTALGYKREHTEQWCYDRLMAALREQLSEADIEKLAAEGAAWSEDQAVEEALKV